MGIVFANGSEDRGSILGHVIQKTQKMILDAALLNHHCYKVRINGKVELIQGKRVLPPSTPGVVAIEKGTFRSPLTTVATLY